MSTLNALITAHAQIATIAQHLDGLSPAERVAECRALGGKQLAQLWEVAKGGAQLALEDFVPAASEGTPVRFCGKNSLPAFTHFEKHFVRKAGTIVGINVQKLAFVTGPGYFTCDTMSDRAGEVLFDYTRVPSTPPVSDWPAPRSNRSGCSFFVYRDMHDYNRRVSKDVVIGMATRLGKPAGQYYVLARAS